MAGGLDEIEEILDPSIPVPEDLEPDLMDILPRGYLSVSQMTLVLKCPRAWYLRYVEGKTQRTSIRPFQGIQVHRAVEQVLEERLNTGVLPSLEMATDLYATEFEKQKPLIEDWEGEDPGASKDTGVNCTKVFYQEAAVTATPVIVEKTFKAIIKTSDGKTRLPVLGRIDSIQTQTETEDAYQSVRETVVADYKKQKEVNPEKELALPRVKTPLRIHDLKVTTDKWSPGDLDNDLQFAIYAGVEHIPDVRVDQVVKGRAKVPRPRYEQLNGVITGQQVNHAVAVAEGVAKTIALGHFPPTDPSNWWCSAQWCGVWQHCRGK